MRRAIPRTRDFIVPPDRIATSPPEHRGIGRDDVQLLVARTGGVTHTRFGDLGRFLDAGDLLVVNTSATRPAAIGGVDADGPVVVHLATEHGPGRWTVELRRPDGSGPVLDATAGDIVTLDGGATAELLRPSGEDAGSDGVRLWRALVTVPGGSVHRHMDRYGRPITYGVRPGRWPLESYQTVFAREPGSAEMASAGRPFSVHLVAELISAGVAIAPITLHAGVSSLEAHEPPARERFAVPESTAALVRHTRRMGGRVIAVGTTVTRALETVAGEDGRIEAGAGWTRLVLGPDRPARAVDGLITGWHEADASHLDLLDAVAGPELVDAAYRSALEGTYLWHEFGDSCLLLP